MMAEELWWLRERKKRGGARMKSEVLLSLLFGSSGCQRYNVVSAPAVQFLDFWIAKSLYPIGTTVLSSSFSTAGQIDGCVSDE